MLLNDEIVLTRDLDASRRVRMWITDRLAPLTLPEPTVEEILLITSELVTNVVMHTSSVPVVELEADAHLVRIGVCDSSPEPARIRDAEPGRPGSWGLRLVDAAADSWGCDRRADGTKVVWFVVSVA